MEDVRSTMEGVWKMKEGGENAVEGILDAEDGIRDPTENMYARGLIRAAHKSCPRNDDEEVEENTK